MSTVHHDDESVAPTERLGTIQRVYERKAHELESLRRTRNDAIREVVAAGTRQAEVARVTGLNRSRIGQIVAGGDG